ncbi:hypothetical protein BDK51DRAFT_41638 [Blyttiomyces helicus]|uniref:Uncharacterized protein n=1 Tax=Blyttiomyces helicus TaxID=388810 RepID=A0A4P9WBU4_9FUNG|nr:hypothetical protein BDK51DRAFT_41638 [Blyttiomyces helicus]|eukprot:RKO89043.1 hypothetical protein BDK51DRAFT_41638 [Blyttiomyces helicus]
MPLASPTLQSKVAMRSTVLPIRGSGLGHPDRRRDACPSNPVSVTRNSSNVFLFKPPANANNGHLTIAKRSPSIEHASNVLAVLAKRSPHECDSSDDEGDSSDEGESCRCPVRSGSRGSTLALTAAPFCESKTPPRMKSVDTIQAKSEGGAHLISVQLASLQRRPNVFSTSIPLPHSLVDRLARLRKFEVKFATQKPQHIEAKFRRTMHVGPKRRQYQTTEGSARSVKSMWDRSPFVACIPSLCANAWVGVR